MSDIGVGRMNQMPKKALLIGSSFSAAPMLARLRRRGLLVAVCGRSPSDPCHAYADESHFIDYSDREQLLELVRKERFDFLVPTCNDYSYMSGAWVARETGHPGFDRYPVAEILHTKDRFRETSKSLNLAVPRAVRTVADVPAGLTEDWFPVLIKPVDSFSGRGVTKISCAEDIPQALTSALTSSRSTAAVIEEFVEGELHSHSAFIAGGRIVLDFFVDEFCSVYPYQVDCSNHPSRLSELIRQGVREDMQRLIDGLQIADGLLHTQFIANAERHWIIETMRRCPGDLYSSLIERSTGIDYTDRFVAGFVGEPPSACESPRLPRLIGRHTISVVQEQIAHAFNYTCSGKLLAIVPLMESGRVLKPAPYDKLAIAFNEYESHAQMLAETQRMKTFAYIESLEPQESLQ